MRTCAYSLVSEGNYWVCFFKSAFHVPKALNQGKSCHMCTVLRTEI